VSLSPEDVAVAWRDRQLEFVQFLVDRVAALESQVKALESTRDALLQCVQWTPKDIEDYKRFRERFAP
jgi:hypothetical protein